MAEDIAGLEMRPAEPKPSEMPDPAPARETDDQPRQSDEKSKDREAQQAEKLPALVVPASNAEPVANAIATTTLDKMSASAPSTYRFFSPRTEGWTLAAKISGPAITAT